MLTTSPIFIISVRSYCKPTRRLRFAVAVLPPWVTPSAAHSTAALAKMVVDNLPILGTNSLGIGQVASKTMEEGRNTEW